MTIGPRLVKRPIDHVWQKPMNNGLPRRSVRYKESGESHQCSVCGKVGKWNKNWQWYGSYQDLEDGKEIIKTCSDNCRKDIEKQPLILGE